ncbi:MAG: hypothetical protein K1060chlam5_00264 [Candidatus Anoxychlamydiales bacterium]|nr:hypothetical protein [Candidatus Anoxychlamydiales bacterium]
MNLVYLPIASTTINAINFFASKKDLKNGEINFTAKKIVEYTSYTCNLSHIFSAIAAFFTVSEKFKFLMIEPIIMPIAFLQLASPLLLGVFKDYLGFENNLEQKFNANKDVKKFENDFSLCKSTNFSDESERVFLINSIAWNVIFSIISPQYAFFYILNSFLNVGTYFNFLKKDGIAITESMHKLIIFRRNSFFPWSTLTIGSHTSSERHNNLELKKFDFTANLRLKKTEKKHFKDRCSVCLNANSNKYYFCTKHIFDLGCILKIFSTKLKEIKFSNFKKTITKHYSSTHDSILDNNSLYDTTSYSIDIHKDSLPKCPLCRQDYHESQISAQYYSPLPNTLEINNYI